MSKIATRFSYLFVFIGSLFFSQVTLANEPLETVPFVDLKQYAGKWYEVARLPNRFQRKCVGNVTAEYSLLENGHLRVQNACEKANDMWEVTTGEAKVKNTETNADLRVAFFKIFGKWIFNGKYLVIGLDPNYKWAVVGAPDRNYGWILSRTPSLEPSVMSDIQKILDMKGYHSCEFMMTPQDGGASESHSVCESREF